MQKSLLDWLVELMERDYPEDWERLCHRAQPIEGDDELARLASMQYWLTAEGTARIRSYNRRDILEPLPSYEISELCRTCIEHFADAFRSQMVGRIKGTLDMKPLDPALITVETLRFDPDELVLDEGKLIIVDVRIEPAPAPLPSPSARPVSKPDMPSGRPREIDHAAITGVAKDCAKKGVEEFLARFVERVLHECGERRPPIRAPKSRSQMREICRPIWNVARDKNT
jgi:hypothetical protein